MAMIALLAAGYLGYWLGRIAQVRADHKDRVERDIRFQRGLENFILKENAKTREIDRRLRCAVYAEHTEMNLKTKTPAVNG